MTCFTIEKRFEEFQERQCSGCHFVWGVRQIKKYGTNGVNTIPPLNMRFNSRWQRVIVTRDDGVKFDAWECLKCGVLQDGQLAPYLDEIWG